MSEAGFDLVERREGGGLVGPLGAETGVGAGAGRELGVDARAWEAGGGGLEVSLGTEAGAGAAEAGARKDLRGLERGWGAGLEASLGASLGASRLGFCFLGGGAAGSVSGRCLLVPAAADADLEAFGIEGAAMTILPMTLTLSSVGMTGGGCIPPLPLTDLNLSLDPYRASQSPFS